MGLYSVVLAVGQLVGAFLGGLFVDQSGFYGLMGFSVVMGLMSLGSVLYMRFHGHDLVLSKLPHENLNGSLPHFRGRWNWKGCGAKIFKLIKIERVIAPKTHSLI
jgi:MFS family permease